LSISNVTMLSIDRGQRRVAQIQGMLPFVPWLTVLIDMLSIRAKMTPTAGSCPPARVSTEFAGILAGIEPTCLNMLLG
jgi:hypothetical protein